MSYPVEKTTQVNEMKGLLLYQFSNSPNILKWIEIWGEQVQELEAEWFDLIESLGIDTAYGFGLDLIGKEVQELRQGKNDTDYRNAILTKIFINNSSGTPEEVISATKQITGATSIKYSEQYPAQVVLEITGAEYVSKAPIIRKTIPAAVDLVFEKKIDIDQVQTYIGVAYSFYKSFESNVKYLDLVEDGTMQSVGYLTTNTRLFTP